MASGADLLLIESLQVVAGSQEKPILDRDLVRLERPVPIRYVLPICHSWFPPMVRDR